MKRVFFALMTLLMLALAACSSLPDAVTEALPDMEIPAAPDSSAEGVAAPTEEPVVAEEPAAAPPQWGYEGNLGPANWANLDPKYATCGTGRKQSPIDLPAGPPTLADVTFDYLAIDTQAINNGHTIEVEAEGGGGIEIGEKTYELRQFHFHALSEHTVASNHYPIEMHLVHLNPDDQSYAVVGVFIKEGVENAALASFWSGLPAETHGTVEAAVNAADLLPAVHTLYRYDGSFTTPECKEGVLWSVLNTPIEMSRAQIEAFTLIFSGNNRPTQPIHEQNLRVD